MQRVLNGNVIAMEEQNHTPALPEESMQTNGNMPTTGTIPPIGMHYYFLDELGSPVRVNGYKKEEGTPSYLTYGYDEFGNDLYEDLEEAGIPNPYSRQGEEQPFGYTGYRYDKVSSTYFAQAREYQPENGRFSAEDVIKGNGAFPETLNHYGYCLNNPMALVDLNGREPENAEEWMKNRGHSYWYTPQGLWESNAELSINSNQLRMSEKGKETLKKCELNVDGKWAADVVVRDEVTNEVIAVYPYYVGDGGITFGYGHYMNYEEVMEDPEERALFEKYINAEITEEIFDDGIPVGQMPRVVPNSEPVPIEELDELFESDVECMTINMLGNFDNRDLTMTIQELDALMIIRFQTGTLGERIAALVESGASIEEWDKVITDKSIDRRKLAKKIYWGNIFDYNYNDNYDDKCIE